jgi:hypothetical protein
LCGREWVPDRGVGGVERNLCELGAVLVPPTLTPHLLRVANISTVSSSLGAPSGSVTVSTYTTSCSASGVSALTDCWGSDLSPPPEKGLERSAVIFRSQIPPILSLAQSPRQASCPKLISFNQGQPLRRDRRVHSSELIKETNQRLPAADLHGARCVPEQILSTTRTADLAQKAVRNSYLAATKSANSRPVTQSGAKL